MELIATEVFEKNYDFVYNSDLRFCLNQGASRSSKSYSVAQLSIIIALNEPNLVISIVRKTFPALRAGMMRDFFEILNNLALYNKKSHNKTQHTYTFENGSMIEFMSVDDQAKVRGRKRHYCIIDEANDLWEDDFLQLNLRTERKLIMMYNPSDRESWLYNLPEDKTLTIISTYKDNPFLGKEQINEIESLKEKDEALWLIFGLGKRAITKENIYSNFTYLANRPEKFTQFLLGIDYGYTHPTAMVKVWHYEDELFIEEIIYEKGLTTPDIQYRIEKAGITYKDLIIAETARPEINEELRRNKFSVINADKNVKGGIDAVKRYKIFTNSNNIIKEYNSYTWAKRAGQLTDEPVKILDDAMDAIRYVAHYLKKYGTNNKTYTIS